MSQIGHFREPKGSARAHTLGTVSKNFAVRAPCACNHETSIDGRISVPRRRQGLETGVLRWQEPREHFSIPVTRTERASPTENASQGTETSETGWYRARTVRGVWGGRNGTFRVKRVTLGFRDRKQNLWLAVL